MMHGCGQLGWCLSWAQSYTRLPQGIFRLLYLLLPHQCKPQSGSPTALDIVSNMEIQQP